jgi:Ca2+-binding EF-hand superfamily protein
MPFSRNLATAIAAAALIALAGNSAHARNADRLASAMFDRMDTNRDGLIAKDEAEAARVRLFDRLDANHDSFVTAAELGAARTAPRRARFARIAELRANMLPSGERLAELDSNRDSKVSRDEFVAGGTPLFDRLDDQGRGLSRADFAAFLKSAR